MSTHLTKTLLFLSLVTFLAGCGDMKYRKQHHTAVHTLPPLADTFTDHYWWKCKFTLNWPEEEDPDFARDLILAHAVIGPILLEARSEIPYWRFHRRASRDAAGHQFTFLFYTKPELAENFFAQIDANPLLETMLENKQVTKVVMDAKVRRGHLADTSDTKWSLPLQKNWPAYIMGISALWLGLIDDLMQGFPDPQAKLEDLILQYQGVHDEITIIWKNEGQHAFLHHLNGIFGYEPLRIQKDIIF